MPIPNTVHQTPEAILKYLEDRVAEAKELWEDYATAVSNAYAWAYNRQVDCLNKIKVSQQASSQADHELVAYALSMFTVGVGGAVAGMIARKLAEGIENKIDQAAAIDGMKNVIQRGMQGPSPNDLADGLDPYPRGAPADVFAPAGVTPTEYWSGLLGGIQNRTTLLRLILNAVRYNRDPTSVPQFDGTQYKLKSSGDRLTLVDARALAEAILNTSFLTDPPPFGITSEKIKKKSELALWIGWAYARDPEYWSAAETPYSYCGNRAYDEQFGWEPVRNELHGLGVPFPEITAYGTEHGWMNRSRPITGLWVWGFMKWATSPAAIHVLFAGLPTKPLGFEEVKRQMLRRQLTDQGWLDIDPERALSDLTGAANG